MGGNVGRVGGVATETPHLAGQGRERQVSVLAITVAQDEFNDRQLLECDNACKGMNDCWRNQWLVKTLTFHKCIYTHCDGHRVYSVMLVVRLTKAP